VTSRKPVADKILNLGDVHKLNVIDMTKFLSFDHHIGRNTFVAHCFRVGLMTLTIFINFESHLRRRKTVITLDILRVDSLAFQLPLGQPVVKRNMGSISDKLISQTMDAFGVGSMLAKHLRSPYFILQVN